MENASKALLIAGSMLLLILIMTLATYIFKQLGSQTSEFYREMSDTEIYEYNQQFFNFENRDLRVQDVITLLNIIEDINKRELVPVVIKVYYRNTDDEIKPEDIKELYDSIYDYEKKYRCEAQYAKNSNYVGKIIITNKE